MGTKGTPASQVKPEPKTPLSKAPSRPQDKLLNEVAKAKPKTAAELKKIEEDKKKAEEERLKKVAEQKKAAEEDEIRTVEELKKKAGEAAVKAAPPLKKPQVCEDTLTHCFKSLY